MFYLTQQERLVLLFIAGVILAGSLLQISSKQFAGMNRFLAVVEQSHISAKIDLNSADFKSLKSIPYIGGVTARAIIKERDLKGGFQSIDELLAVSGIGPRKFELIKQHVKIDIKEKP